MRAYLIIRQQSLRLSTVEIIVPDADEGQNDRQVLFQLGRLEMPVHLVRARQELVKVLVADREGDGEADRGPERVAAANPVPELEHVV